MIDNQVQQPLRPWQKTKYRIVVEGDLRENTSMHFHGMTLATQQRPDMAVASILTGEVDNQKELEQILTILFSMHFPILEVKNL